MLIVENLITYWKVFGSSEVPIPKGAETLIADTIQALEEYKKVLQGESKQRAKRSSDFIPTGNIFAVIYQVNVDQNVDLAFGNIITLSAFTLRTLFLLTPVALYCPSA
ncbi:unnamed protein product [marine sediment metagenome]|uniref:Uncharacterized protein n=1 Tax=marine sediment metagenome TaxID=412755 RepID=X1SDA5_9ZZZZ